MRTLHLILPRLMPSRSFLVKTIVCRFLAPVDQVAEPADAIEDRTLFLAPAFALRRGGVDAIRHAAERQRLQPHAAGALQRREEDAFSAEERRLDPADELDVVVDAGLQRHQASRIDAHRLTGSEIEVVDRAAGVHEAEAVAFELLHDEALAAEQADAERVLERDADRHTAGRAQERVLLADEVSAKRLQIHRDDLAGIRRAERDLLFAAGSAGGGGEHR